MLVLKSQHGISQAKSDSWNSSDLGRCQTYSGVWRVRYHNLDKLYDPAKTWHSPQSCASGGSPGNKEVENREVVMAPASE